MDGLVEAVSFEEGQRVKKGKVLVKLSDDLLHKTLKAEKASYEEVLSDLERAERELARADNLYKEELISEQTYDDRKFSVKGITNKSQSLKAKVERLEAELQKKVIKAPFSGVVIKKHVDRGEWISRGASVATIARDDVVDIVVEIPEQALKAVKQGTNATVRAGENEIRGKVFAVIPQGDISTRTFPVKIRIRNSMSLKEGMEARVSLPVRHKRKTLIVLRDAVITVFGDTVVFAVIDSEARMIPVEVVGYQGMTAGVHAEGLAEGMSVVIKGNERLMDGQRVEITDKSQAPGTP
jgi:RND family efflux transporter MFP subunit